MINVCYLTNNGKVRTNNEDSLLVQDLIVSERNMTESEAISTEAARSLFVVADGMGGHSKGEIASRKVLEFLRENHLLINSSEDIPVLLKLARKVLNELAVSDKEALGLGTTVAGILIVESKAIVFNCGDSRVYRLNGRFLEKLTRDHSFVQNLADVGEITEEEMRTHPRKNILTSAILGDLKEDLPEVFFRELPIAEGQRFLICSDGAWECLSIDDLEECFIPEGVQKSVSELYSKIMASEAGDNFSLIVLERVKHEQP